MARLPLLGGSYSPRSIIANSQRCINLYPERNPEGAPVPVTHYQRPGLRAVVGTGLLPVRGLYQPSNGVGGFAVSGNGVYYIDQNWAVSNIGQIGTNNSNPVSFIDNGANVLLVDGSPNGWIMNLDGSGFGPFNDPTGLFQGADRVDTIDTFVISNQAGGGTNEWISTLSNSMTYDPTYFAFKSAYPDPLQTLIVNHHNIFLVGLLKTEIWFNAGLSTFPFMMIQGAYYEHGTAAKYSVASNDISVFFLGNDLQGQGVVWRIGGGDQYSARRISNHALEYQIRKMNQTVGTTDAIGYCYQEDGHFYYVLTFPAGDQTWVYDDSIGASPLGTDAAWHQECWTDPETGILHRHRAMSHAMINGWHTVGDWQDGTIYVMDPTIYTDTVNNVTCPCTYIRTFPHIGTGEIEIGIWGRRPVPADGHRIEFHNFMLDLECGNAPQTIAGEAPTVILRYSDDRGRTYSSDVLQTGGNPGEYLTWPTWKGLGIARDRVFEVEYAFQGEAALNGAWIEGTVLES